MKTKLFLVILVNILLLSSCSNTAREKFLAEHTEVTDEIIRIIEANPSEEGVKEAENYFQSKKKSLRENFEAGKSSFNLGSSDGDKFYKVISANFEKLAAFQEKNSDFINHSWKLKIPDLIEDFQTFLLKPAK